MYIFHSVYYMFILAIYNNIHIHKFVLLLLLFMLCFFFFFFNIIIMFVVALFCYVVLHKTIFNALQKILLHLIVIANRGNNGSNTKKKSINCYYVCGWIYEISIRDLNNKNKTEIHLWVLCWIESCVVCCGE